MSRGEFALLVAAAFAAIGAFIFSEIAFLNTYQIKNDLKKQNALLVKQDRVAPNTIQHDGHTYKLVITH